MSEAQRPRLRFRRKARWRRLASRLQFDCRPKGLFLGLPVNGRRVTFAENVFYQFRDERVAEVWPVLDKGANRSAALTSGRSSDGFGVRAEKGVGSLGNAHPYALQRRLSSEDAHYREPLDLEYGGFA
jgi:hypothetical protein